ncbi:hypothetical protein [Phenylobacterium sp.]|uniref:hypothetical protein n=1 Tax=Phenylobacterium sp. TaxID=1871053 RepID=UPI003D2BCD3A
MSIRRTFLILVVPLFLLLAGVNAGLVYFWERAEAERGLEAQAIAAAVTVAAFADTHELGAALADPVRDAGIKAAAKHVTGLTSLYIVDPDGRLWQLAGNPPPGGRTPFARPTRPTALPIEIDTHGHRRITGLAPAAGGRFVVARIDAEVVFDRMENLLRLLVVLVAGAGLVGLVLALVIARRIVRELAGSNAMIEAIRTDAPAADIDGFKIRETRDLALAVRLMRTSVQGRLARGRHELARRDRERDEAASSAAFHETAFPALTVEAGGAAVAIRRLGRPPAGSFYALARDGDRAGLVMGVCAGETPAAALAQALAAQRYFEAHLLDGNAQDRIAEAKAAFGADRLAWRTWSTAEPMAAAAVSLLDPEDAARAEVYVGRAQSVAAADIVEDLGALLNGPGFVAVLG